MPYKIPLYSSLLTNAFTEEVKCKHYQDLCLCQNDTICKSIQASINISLLRSLGLSWGIVW